VQWLGMKEREKRQRQKKKKKKKRKEKKRKKNRVSSLTANSCHGSLAKLLLTVWRRANWLTTSVELLRFFQYRSGQIHSIDQSPLHINSIEFSLHSPDFTLELHSFVLLLATSCSCCFLPLLSSFFFWYPTFLLSTSSFFHFFQLLSTSFNFFQLSFDFFQLLLPHHHGSISVFVLCCRWPHQHSSCRHPLRASSRRRPPAQEPPVLPHVRLHCASFAQQVLRGVSSSEGPDVGRAGRTRQERQGVLLCKALDDRDHCGGC